MDVMVAKAGRLAQDRRIDKGAAVACICTAKAMMMTTTMMIAKIPLCLECTNIEYIELDCQMLKHRCRWRHQGVQSRTAQTRSTCHTTCGSGITYDEVKFSSMAGTGDTLHQLNKDLHITSKLGHSTVTVRARNSRKTGHMFNTQLFHCHVTTLGVGNCSKHVPLPPSSLIWYWPKSSDTLSLGW